MRISNMHGVMLKRRNNNELIGKLPCGERRALCEWTASWNKRRWPAGRRVGGSSPTPAIRVTKLKEGSCTWRSQISIPNQVGMEEENWKMKNKLWYYWWVRFNLLNTWVSSWRENTHQGGNWNLKEKAKAIKVTAELRCDRSRGKNWFICPKLGQKYSI